MAAGSGAVGGKSDGHVNLAGAAAHQRRARFGMLALLRRQAQAITQEGFHQHDHLATVSRPHPGFGQGQGYVVVIAAFATAYTGKRRIH
ncbi:hypothetical protein D3C73_1329160 [compost metagenome]